VRGQDQWPAYQKSQKRKDPGEPGRTGAEKKTQSSLNPRKDSFGLAAVSWEVPGGELGREKGQFMRPRYKQQAETDSGSQRGKKSISMVPEKGT